MSDKVRRDNGLQRSVGERGFSLLEVIVCLAVLAIAIPAFLGAIVQNVQLEAMNNEMNIAVNTATGIIEEVHTLGYAEVNGTNLPATFEATGLGNDARTVKLTNSAGSTQVGRVIITENAAKTAKTVQVQVTWRGVTGGDMTIELLMEVTNY